MISIELNALVSWFSNIFPTSINYFYDNAYSLIFITASIFIYAFLIDKFYHFVAKRDVFGIAKDEKLFKGQTFLTWVWQTIQTIIHYGGIFPFFVFIWFAGFSVILSVMAKSMAPEQLLLLAVTFVAAIRISAYYSEDLAKDLAKLIPLALLALLLVEPSFFSTNLLEERVKAIGTLIPQSLSFLAFIMILEWCLRLLLWIKNAIFGTVSSKTIESA